MAGTELEGGHVAYSCMQISFLFDRLLAQRNSGEQVNDVESKESGESVPKMTGSLSLFSDGDCEKLSLVKKALDQCCNLLLFRLKNQKIFLKF